MNIFNFNQTDCIGKVYEVDSYSISVLSPFNSKDNDFAFAKVGKLVAFKMDEDSTWVIGLINRIRKDISDSVKEIKNVRGDDAVVYNDLSTVSVLNVTLIATLQGNQFTRSIFQVPDIDSQCFLVNNENIASLMTLLNSSADEVTHMKVGKYTIDNDADAYVDGNKLFQRHAAILGSTGSGKSWTVASLLERVNELPSSNVVVFDLHGEYVSLKYADVLTVPGPNDTKDNHLHLPYWLLSAQELQSLFIDRSEFTATNQIAVFQEAVIKAKENYLNIKGNPSKLPFITLNTPIPFDIGEVVHKMKHLDTEMVEGAKGQKQGKYFGMFGRLINRMENRINDKRYAFMFSSGKYDDILESIVKSLFDNSKGGRVKVIDFSEVPKDVLSIILGLVARIIYDFQYWTNSKDRKPVVMVCDEAHLYLPKKDGMNPVELKAIETFERISKEGRKYGVSLLVVSQRPSDVSDTILSQCNNIIALRLTNATDQLTVRRFMPESFSAITDMLPILNVGEAFIVGDSVLLPLRIKLFVPKDKPLSSTIDFLSEWSKDVEVKDFSKTIKNIRKQERS